MTSRCEPGARSVLEIRRLGRLSYDAGVALQNDLVARRKEDAIPDQLLLLEHEPTITLGRNARPQNILFSEAALAARGVTLRESGRGGDVTYHGPGQLVAYPILNLAPDRCDVHRYVRDLEEAIIGTCADLGIAGERVTGRTGVWVGDAKVAAIGVRISRWVTSHGLALNVTTDLDAFSLIVPCGISDRPVTSLARLLPAPPTLDAVADLLAQHLAAVFERTPHERAMTAEEAC